MLSFLLKSAFIIFILLLLLIVIGVNRLDFSSERKGIEVVEIGDLRIASQEVSEYIAYRGMISTEGFTALKQVYENRRQKNNIRVTTINIDSRGGNSLAALEMAEWILKEELNVLVSRRCFSACANFVFLAGKTKILFDHSELVWHGSATEQRGIDAGVNRGMRLQISKLDDEQLLASLHEMFEINLANVHKQFPNVTREEYAEHFIEEIRNSDLDFHNSVILARDIDRLSAFYARIGVDPMIANYGFDQIENSKEALPSEFYYSLEDLARMGVTNIHLRDGKWEPRYRIPVFQVDPKYIQSYQTH
ncbi:hypothetical protein [Glaciecola sp. SC05]|uniref:hypothetical protein n=1 Tax=Glaciecola sp. SC05 TaxID=1987355 RepID=UPI0035285975